MNNELGNEIKEKRMYWGFSQADLAILTGTDIKTISLIERGARQKPKPETIKKLAKALDLYDLDLLRMAGYTKDEQIEYMKNIRNEKKFEFDYTVIYKGHGMLYAYDKDDAELYLNDAFQDITGTFSPEIDAIDEKIELDECKTYLNVGESDE